MGKYTVILTPEAKDELRVLHKIGIEATIRKITEMKVTIEAGIRLKAGFDRQYNTPTPSTPTASITKTTATVPTPTPQLMSLA